MITAFQEHIRQKSLLDPKSTYLFACSGGIDSMVLGCLLIESHIPFEVAHVNFHLRAEESDGDEVFVKNWCASHDLVCHIHAADAYEVAENQKISIQMAAREIRYDWFEQVRSSRNLKGIILAHQEDDQIETVFLNLLRGTGLDGMIGMAERRGHLIRPLLPFSRTQIADFASEHNIIWREDSSNSKTDYKRNKLRLESLPALLQTAPDSRKNLLHSFSRIKDASKAFSSLMQYWLSNQVRTEDDFQFLPISAVKHTSGATSLLYFWLKPYGFNSDQAEEILQTIQHPESGKFFENSLYRLTVDRETLILAPQAEKFTSITLQKDDIECLLGNTRYELLKVAGDTPLDKSKENAMLDLEKISFPLEIRSWEQGDKFIPLGMKNSKKISDFLIDLKVSLAEKERVKVLISEGKIAWVIGYRIADWAKCDASTRKTLYLKKK
ncbi:tRNA lysidine(34) synthetase TilS [Algoriphagus vanfongensis]|uniref:tRNA lysidine(34) synthetase TilS n=1 Tax=Algoriphagus vanfongensis TaxID=426371 RepID=UPI0004162DD5|nr:tRNA lysidine(34) synthetase TilS [Algoriphagus vanfongensis]